jgi:acyl-CoA thioester hydrolase
VSPSSPPTPSRGPRRRADALPDVWFETPVRVRYAETDKMGVVYYGNYFAWFEIGRTDVCRQCGFSYRDMEIERDAFLMVVSASCRYRRPAHYDDELIVRTRLASFARRTMSFDYRVLRADTGELLAEGSTSHVVTTADGRVRAFPDAEASLIAARLNALSAAVTVDPSVQREQGSAKERSS